MIAPPAVLAVGLNYAAHSSELGLKTDAAPTVFTLWPNSLTGHEQTTSWPRSLSEAVDYEAELGVLIGTPAKDVSEADALSHVWGYTVVNDITARNIQFSEAQWSRCKSFDGFTPTGPFAVTADEISDPQDLHIWAVVDGHTVQDASTDQMVRSVAKLIAHLSQSLTLLPGTLISTGSPGGAGYSRDPQIFLRDHSTVTVGIDGIGELTTHCRITDLSSSTHEEGDGCRGIHPPLVLAGGSDLDAVLRRDHRDRRGDRLEPGQTSGRELLDDLVARHQTGLDDQVRDAPVRQESGLRERRSGRVSDEGRQGGDDADRCADHRAETIAVGGDAVDTVDAQRPHRLGAST